MVSVRPQLGELRMLMSYAIPHSEGRFFLPQRVREVLHLNRNCRLHGRLVDDLNEPAIILSPIPVSDWNRCFRVVVHTKEIVGALHTTLKVIQEADLNILHMVAAAASAAGHLTVTAIVSNIKQPVGRATRRAISPQAEVAEKLKSEIRGALKSVLTASPMYLQESQSAQDHPELLEPVEVSPLMVLRSLSSVTPEPNSMLGQRLGKELSSDFSFNMRNGVIDLGDFPLGRAPGKPGPAPSLFEAMTYKAVAKSVQLVLTADPFEYHLRVAVLPLREYVRIEVPLKVTSNREASMLGVSREIVGTFVDRPCPINVYFSSSSIVEATTPNLVGKTKITRRSKKCTERLRIKIVGDASNILKDKPDKTTSDQIIGEIQKRVKQLRVEMPDRIVRFDDECGDGGVRVYPLLAPLVFMATNVKPDPSVSTDHICMALELCATLKDLHFRPVFVPTLTGASTAREQMTTLLKGCPMLVSLYVEEEGMQLSRSTKMSRPHYAPSAWTTFEEAFMTSMSNRQVYRILHKNVFPPPFTDSTLSLEYSTLEDGIRELRRLRSRILACQDSETWRRALRESGDVLANQGIDLERVDASDPERWLRDGLESHDRMEEVDARLKEARSVLAQRKARIDPMPSSENSTNKVEKLKPMRPGTRKKKRQVEIEKLSRETKKSKIAKLSNKGTM